MYAARNKNSVLTSWAVGNALSFSFENTSVSLIVTSKEAEIKVMQYVSYLLSQRVAYFTNNLKQLQHEHI